MKLTVAFVENKVYLWLKCFLRAFKYANKFICILFFQLNWESCSFGISRTPLCDSVSQDTLKAPCSLSYWSHWSLTTSSTAVLTTQATVPRKFRTRKMCKFWGLVMVIWHKGKKKSHTASSPRSNWGVQSQSNHGSWRKQRYCWHSWLCACILKNLVNLCLIFFLWMY